MGKLNLAPTQTTGGHGELDEFPQHGGQRMLSRDELWSPELPTCREGEEMADEMHYRQSRRTRSMLRQKMASRHRIRTPVAQLRRAPNFRNGSFGSRQQQQSRWHLQQEEEDFIIEIHTEEAEEEDTEQEQVGEAIYAAETEPRHTLHHNQMVPSQDDLRNGQVLSFPAGACRYYDGHLDQDDTIQSQYSFEAPTDFEDEVIDGEFSHGKASRHRIRAPVGQLMHAPNFRKGSYGSWQQERRWHLLQEDAVDEIRAEETEEEEEREEFEQDQVGEAIYETELQALHALHHNQMVPSRDDVRKGPASTPPAGADQDSESYQDQDDLAQSQQSQHSFGLPTCFEGKVMDDRLPSRQSSNANSKKGSDGSPAADADVDYGGCRDQDDNMQSLSTAPGSRATSVSRESSKASSQMPTRSQSQNSFVSARSYSMRSLSVSRELSSQMPMWEGADPEDWSEASDTASSPLGSKCGSEGKDEDRLVLLKHSRAVKVGPGRDFLMVRIVRTSLSQPFGLKFGASESNKGQPTTVVAAEDYPYLCVKKRDHLVSVNSVQVRQASDITGALEKAFSVTLVFQRRGTPFHGPQAWVKDCRVPMAEVNRSLLSVTKAKIVNRKKGEFMLSLHRKSLVQKFGLPCEAVASKSGPREMVIIISKDMPHLALMKHDRLDVINGVEPRSRSEYVSMNNNSLSLDLICRRQPSRLRDLVHQIEEVGDDDPEVEDSDPFQLWQICGLCNMCGPDEADMHEQSLVYDPNSYQGQPPSPSTVQSIGRPMAHATNGHRRPGSQQEKVVEYDAIGGAMSMQAQDCPPGLLCLPSVAVETGHVEVFEGARKTHMQTPQPALKSPGRSRSRNSLEDPLLINGKAMQRDPDTLRGFSEPEVREEKIRSKGSLRRKDSNKGPEDATSSYGSSRSMDSDRGREEATRSRGTARGKDSDAPPGFTAPRGHEEKIRSKGSSGGRDSDRGSEEATRSRGLSRGRDSDRGSEEATRSRGSSRSRDFDRGSEEATRSRGSSRSRDFDKGREEATRSRGSARSKKSDAPSDFTTPRGQSKKKSSKKQSANGPPKGYSNR